MKIKGILFVLLISLSVISSFTVGAEELPRSSPENCFYIMPLFEQIRVAGRVSPQEKREQVFKMKAQLGEGNLYHRLGFSFIYAPGVDNEVRPVCELAEEAGTHLGLIFALQSHTRNALRNVADSDFRLYQWRKDGVDWKGAYTNSGELEVAEDERDYKIPSPSRYAIVLRDYNANVATAWGNAVRSLMDDYPGVVTCVNGPVEEELAIGGRADQNKLADYSPYAITEFRDWLLHRGMYDASTGKFPGEGASNLIVGNLMTIAGALRSQFYDDPSPEENNGTGISFNAFFGRTYTTWNLRYWDLELFPQKITDESFDCTPETGVGFTSGGFDAPRTMIASSKYWRAWSYDIPDQGGQYPAGNPNKPAYGFRQTMVRNLVRDQFDVIEKSGIPREMMYAHQIPGEALGNFTGAEGRNRSSASTVWTGYLEKSGTVGITRFGPINPDLMTQYADDWGIFEWHTSPNTDPNASTLYTKSISDLNRYYTNKCHYLFPGWWKHLPDDDKRFPLNDSKFSTAIYDFMKARDEVPYHLQGSQHNYSAPLVTGLYGFFNDEGKMELFWDDKIWLDLLPKWSDWGQFSHFEIQWSANGENWGNSTITEGYSTEIDMELTSVQVRIRANSTADVKGVWSEVITVDSESQNQQISLVSEFQSMDANPDLFNKITFSLKDENAIISEAALNINLSGEGILINTQPKNTASIEKFWPMNSSAELKGLFRVDDAKFDAGFFHANVSPLTPIDPYFYFVGSNIDGSQLPYISFRMYSDITAEGQLYWFVSGGNKSHMFTIEKGWHVYTFNNLPDWVSQQTINSVRLDPGKTALAKIKLDWMAISASPIANELVIAPFLNGNEVTFLTSPTDSKGSYTVKVEYNGLSKSVTVLTGSVDMPKLKDNGIFIYPNPAHDRVFVKLDKNGGSRIRIINLDGTIINNWELIEGIINEFSIDHLAKGMYLIQVINDTHVLSEKLIKH